MNKYLCIVLICNLFLATIKSMIKELIYQLDLLTPLLYILFNIFMTEVNRGFFVLKLCNHE